MGLYKGSNFLDPPRGLGRGFPCFVCICSGRGLVARVVPLIGVYGDDCKAVVPLPKPDSSRLED